MRGVLGVRLHSLQAGTSSFLMTAIVVKSLSRGFYGIFQRPKANRIARAGSIWGIFPRSLARAHAGTFSFELWMVGRLMLFSPFLFWDALLRARGEANHPSEWGVEGRMKQGGRSEQMEA